MKDKILILFSGGMDSCGVLYKCLTEPEYDHLDVHAHHVHLINRLHRDKAEAIACKNITKWLRKQGHQFEYTESTVDYSFASALPWDTEICWCIGAMIAQTDISIKYAEAGRHAEDEDASAHPIVIERLDKVFEYMTASQHRNFEPVKNLPVVKHMSKKEIWFYLPEELRKMVWFCRAPINKGESIEPCWKCHTCEYVKDNKLI